MRILRFILVASTLLLVTSVSAQVQYSIGNFLRYGNGEITSAGQGQRFEYVENQTNARLFWSDFTIGFQYLHDDPPEFGPRFTGLKKRYAEFSRHMFEIRAGDFYTLYGKGLSMNLFENRGINYDTGLDGLRGIYRHDYVNAILAVGNMRYYDLLNPNRIETYSVKSGNVEIKPLKGVSLGASIVGTNGELPSPFGIDRVEATIPEILLSVSALGFDFHASFAHKRASVDRPKGAGQIEHFTREGQGLYGSLSYASEIGFGVTLEYKDYRFDPVDPFERVDINRPTRMLPMQNPPTVMKEHLFYFLAKNQHIVDFNDEVGFQIDGYYSLAPEMTLNINASMASRQKSYSYGVNGLKVIERSNSFLPSPDSIFSPFYEVYAEFEWFFSGHSYVRAAFNRRYDAPYEEFGNLPHVISSWTIPIRIEYGLSDDYSVGVSLEHQIYHDSFVRNKPDYTNDYFAATLSRSSLWSLTARFEATTDDNDPSGKKFWSVGEISYRVSSAHTATLSYGRERGGLVCSNGICRVLNPFDGVRFSLLSQL